MSLVTPALTALQARISDLEARLLEVTEQRDALKHDQEDWQTVGMEDACDQCLAEADRERERAERAEAALKEISILFDEYGAGSLQHGAWMKFRRKVRAVLGDPPTTGKDG